MMYYTYILKSEKVGTTRFRDGRFYTGVTSDLRKRLSEHNKGIVKSTKYRIPLRLIYYEACISKEDAYRREIYLKTGRGKRYLYNRLKKGMV